MADANETIETASRLIDCFAELIGSNDDAVKWLASIAQTGP